jgi:hypothetical protein
MLGMRAHHILLLYALRETNPWPNGHLGVGRLQGKFCLFISDIRFDIVVGVVVHPAVVVEFAPPPPPPLVCGADQCMGPGSLGMYIC